MLRVLFLCILLIPLCTYCRKDEEEPEIEGITIDDLIGSWAFLTLEFNGKTTSGCDLALNQNYDFVTLDFYNVRWNYLVSAPAMLLNSSCVDNNDEPTWQKNYQFSLADSLINCNDEWKFKIIYLGPFQNIKALKVKLLFSSIPDVPINGIYTLGKTP